MRDGVLLIDLQSGIDMMVRQNKNSVWSLGWHVGTEGGTWQNGSTINYIVQEPLVWAAYAYIVGSTREDIISMYGSIEGNMRAATYAGLLYEHYNSIVTDGKAAGANLFVLDAKAGLFGTDLFSSAPGLTDYIRPDGVFRITGNQLGTFICGQPNIPWGSDFLP